MEEAAATALSGTLPRSEAVARRRSNHSTPEKID